MADRYKILSTVWIKEKPDASSKSVASLAMGSSVEISEMSGDWYHISTPVGWAYGKAADGSVCFEKLKEGETATVTPTPAPDDTSIPATAGYQPVDPTYDTSKSNIEYINSLDGLDVTSLKGIHGMPYQYMRIADTRIDPAGSEYQSFGRQYTDVIVSKMPLLLITPGKPEFLTKGDSDEKKSLMEFALGLGDKIAGSMDSILKREGKYYSLKFDYIGYFNHVNPMCRAAARFLGVHDRMIDKVYLDNYDWYENVNKKIKNKSFIYNGCIPFYINSETQISESFSTSTTQSMLASKTNGLSDMGREINFLLGGVSAKTGLDLDKALNQNSLDNNMQNTNDMISKMAGTGTAGDLIKSITGNLQTVFAGGKLIFPEIWSDSQFSRSHNVNIKLTTPDNDILSWYLNICVPLMHLIGLAAPKQAGINGYISPFLIRAYYKGLFNCDMGIITNMSINKGAESAWTSRGLPTTVDVSFEIKDLYSAMAITSNKNIKNGLMNNIILMDYIANMCGVNINEPDLKRTIALYYTQNVSNKIVDAIRLDVMGGMNQWATNKILGLIGGK